MKSFRFIFLMGLLISTFAFTARAELSNDVEAGCYADASAKVVKECDGSQIASTPDGSSVCVGAGIACPACCAKSFCGNNQECIQRVTNPSGGGKATGSSPGGRK